MPNESKRQRGRYGWLTLRYASSARNGSHMYEVMTATAAPTSASRVRRTRHSRRRTPRTTRSTTTLIAVMYA